MRIPNLLSSTVGCALVTLILLLTSASVHASPAEIAAQSADLRSLERGVRDLASASQRPLGSDGPSPLIEQANQAQSSAERIQSALTTPIAQIDERINQLGEDAADSPDADVRKQFAALSDERERAVALSRRAALAQVEASQLGARLTEQQARDLSGRLMQKSPSPLGLGIWAAAVQALPQDLAQAGADGEMRPDARFAALGSALLLAWLGLTVALLRLVARPLRTLGLAASMKLSDRAPLFSKAFTSAWWVVLGTGIAMLSAAALLWGLQLLEAPSVLQRIAGALASGVVFGLYVHTLGVAIFQPEHESVRSLALGNDAARLAARSVDGLAAGMGAVLTVEAIGADFELSPASLLGLDAAVALVSSLSLAFALRALWQMRAHIIDAGRQGRLTIGAGIGWVAVSVIILSGALGYVALANEAAHWITWIIVVALTTYLILNVVDASCRLLPARRSAMLRTRSASRAIEQAAVILSAILRVFVLFLACGALLVPFGAGFTSVLEVFGSLAAGFEVGGINVSVMAAVRAAAAFGVVWALMKLIRGWLFESYLPTTALQPDARDSIDKILRYLTLVLATLWALTAFGIGMEKVAILASALSVGIGFGLQAITQNFISGLILLVERPVKIGDWVKLNDVEGDVRRINVRSTEIGVGDHSTMIVPNSELITKVVQNITKGNSLGRVQILLLIPLDNDLDAVIEAVRQTLAADDATLDTPAPAVFVDRIEGALATLNCFAHVRSPRDAYGTRSRLMLALLREFKAREIEIALPPQNFVLAPALPGEKEG